MRLALLTLAVLLPLAVAAQTPCGADAEAMRGLLQTDYGGRDLLLDAGRAAELDRLVAEAVAAPTPAACDSLLHTATALFPDGHLGVDTPRPVPERFWPARRYGPWGGDLGVRFVGDEAAVLRIPSFDISQKAAIDSLLLAHGERLGRTPYLVVNLQSNGGGSDDSFAELLPLLYARPIRMAGAEVVASAGNVDYYASFLDDPRFDPETLELVSDIVASLRRVEPGAFAPMGEPGVFDVEFDGPAAMPRAVALVVDGAVGSSAEELVLMARTSAKVTVVGTPTAGALDYSNLRLVALPSGERTLRLPTSRRAWLPGFSVDAAGIAPDVVVPRGVTDWDAFALGVLVAREGVAPDAGVRTSAERK